MNNKKPDNHVNNLFLTSASVFCILLLIFSFLAIYFSYHDKKSRITSSMEMISTYTSQEYGNILNNFWQAYMPVYETMKEDSTLVKSYFAAEDELTPQEKNQLSSLLKRMSLRDNRITWIALYSALRPVNYIQYANDTSINTLPDSFPYIKELTDKKQQMEVYGMRYLNAASAGNETFAISGGVPFGFGKGSIIIGYKTSTLAQSATLFPDNVKSMEYYVISNGQVVYNSEGNYDIGSLYQPDGETDGIHTVNGTRKYVQALPSGNASSYVVCSINYGDMLRSVHKDTPLLLAVFIAFFGFSVFIGRSIQRQVAEEVAVIKEGLNILAENNLDYQLPTNFRQNGFPEIAQDINMMSSRLNESIKKAYYFELKQKDAEMAELQATFNPHFLYNTLEILRNKCYSNGDSQTAGLIANLASIFRSFIGAKTFVTFREELAFSKKYLSLLIARYGDLVSFRYDFDSALLNYGIIRNVFQLLIENYFVHGFDANRPDNEIEFMGTFLDEDNIQLLVKDNGYGMTEEEVVVLNQKIEEPIRHSRENFGLKNLNQRLKLFYGPSYGLHIEKNESGGITVFIKIRKMTVEEYEENRKQLREPEGDPGSR